eukprot:6213414-Pleurochrysis_carterae.AAC.7
MPTCTVSQKQALKYSPAAMQRCCRAAPASAFFAVLIDGQYTRSEACACLWRDSRDFRLSFRGAQAERERFPLII